MRWFLDSYAIIEMARGNPAYARYREGSAVTSFLHLLEAYYILLDQGAGELATATLASLGPASVDLPLAMIPTMAQLRLTRRGSTGRRFSYADAAGYVYARERGYAFLTGAHEFNGFPGVEFVR